MTKNWVLICLFNLLVAGSIGFLLRLSQCYEINISYSNFLHGHSHVAILGWLYMIFFVLIYLKFIPKTSSNKAKYNIVFWITQFSVFGMMISFPLQGYAAFSIAFSTLHVFCSYYFCWISWKNLTARSLENLFLKTALLFILISTMGIWGLGAVIATQGKGSSLYSIMIQFFLHFQINGWFFMAVLALIIRQIKSHYKGFIKKIKLFYWLNIIAVVLTFTYPVSWFVSALILKMIYSIGFFLQLLSLFIFLKNIIPVFNQVIERKNFLIRVLYATFIVSYTLKLTFQIFLLIPYISDYSHLIRVLFLGFIHLEVLGIYTSCILLFLLQEKNLFDNKNIWIKTGIVLFIAFYIFTEILLFTQGFFIFIGAQLIPSYFSFIAWSSLLFPLGIISLIFGLIKQNKTIYSDLKASIGLI